MRTACVIAVAKARELLEPLVHQLGYRLAHVLRRMLPISMYLLQARGRGLVGGFWVGWVGFGGRLFGGQGGEGEREERQPSRIPSKTKQMLTPTPPPKPLPQPPENTPKTLQNNPANERAQKDGQFLSGHDLFLKRVGASYHSFIDEAERSCKARRGALRTAWPRLLACSLCRARSPPAHRLRTPFLSLPLLHSPPLKPPRATPANP